MKFSIYLKRRVFVMPGPADPRYALPLQRVEIQISWPLLILKKPTDLDMHCLLFSMAICINSLDQVI